MTRLIVNRVGQLLRVYRRLAIALVLLVAVYTAVGFWLVPYIARAAIEKYVVQGLHRQVAIKEITFNPFTLTATVTGFALAEADNTPIASFDLLRINAQLSSIVYRAWTFAEVRLDRPNINVLIAEDGTLNLSKLHSADAPAPESGSAVRVPPVRIATFAVRDGRIAFQDRDRSRSSPFTTTLAPLEFTLTDFRTAADFQNAYSFEGTTLAGERLAWSGQFSIQPLGSTGRFQTSNLKASTIASYLGDSLGFDLRSGSLDVEGEYRALVGDKLLLNVDLPTSKLHDVAIGPKGEKESAPWISLPAVELSRTSLALQDRRITVEGIQVENPKLGIWREADGRLNLASLVNPSPESATSSQTSADWSVSVGTLAIRAASIEAEDRMVEPTAKLSLTPLSVTVSGYSTKPDTVMKMDLNSGTGDAGRISAQGDVTLEPFAANLSVDVAGFELPPLQPYLAESTALQLASGKVSLKGALKMGEASVGSQSHLDLAGDVVVANVAIRDKASAQNLINWESVEAKGVSYSQNPDRLEIQQVEAHRPYARVIISEERSLNIAAALTPRVSVRSHPASAHVASASAAKPMPVRIRSTGIQDGSMDFSDRSVEPNFSATIVGLTGGVSGLSSDEASRADVKLAGTVDRYAPVDITGRVNLLSAALFTDVAANFHNMELTTFNPYSGKYAGYSISKGKVSTELHYKVDNRRLDAQHHIVLDQLEFGAATESKYKVPLPIRLAAALLKDRHGIIDINLPVSGSLDDPEFRVGPIVWKAFVGLMEKAVTSPFRLMGSLFGRGEEIGFVDFIPGSATLTSEQKDKLATLAKGLIERPQLRLDIPLRTVSAADDDVLTSSQLDAALAALLPSAGATAVVTQEQRLTALTQLYQQQFSGGPVFPPAATPEADTVGPHIAFLEKELQSRFTPTTDQRVQLARSRADVVQEAVLANTEISSERVFLTDRDSGKTAATGIVRMEFRLE
jgi:uncharacterized protein involved in outer membrane biogenesis